MPRAAGRNFTAHRLGTLCLAACVASAGGCTKSAAPPAPVAVRGRVEFMGQPLARGLVVFTPDRERGHTGPPLAARLDNSGHYELNPAPPIAPGAPAGVSQGIAPGWYAVSFAESNTPNPGPRFPAELHLPDRSGVARQVVAGRENVIDFVIQVGQ